ncbi:MAG: Nucleoside-diphosphate sugar epimerase [Frankiales bacterium]|nr:Nucleoside-diphosphate sugar epimerase [Frankiales bacterium]
MNLALTGSTGRLGGAVAAQLADLDPLLLVRDPSRAPAGRVQQSSYDEPGPLEGITTLFMVSGAESADRVGQHRSMIEAAAAAGVQHVVYTSFLGAAPDATFTLARDHWATEELVRASGMAWTFLRNQMYAEMIPLFATDGVIRGPAGQGRFAPVCLSDVADVAALVLRDPHLHKGKTYDLTGPELFTMGELAALHTASGRQTEFVDETVEEAYASRSHYGEPDWQVTAWVSTYTAIGDGSLDVVTTDVEDLLGRPATAMAQLLG